MSKANRPIKVFLCYARDDSEAVKALYSQMIRGGVDVWLDKENLIPGQDWELEIRKAVRKCDVVVVCLSNKFKQAGYRQKEVRLALDTAMEKPDGDIFIIPGRLENCDILESLKKWQWVDLFEKDGYQALMRALQTRAINIGITSHTRKKSQKRASTSSNLKKRSENQVKNESTSILSYTTKEDKVQNSSKSISKHQSYIDTSKTITNNNDTSDSIHLNPRYKLSDQIIFDVIALIVLLPKTFLQVVFAPTQIMEYVHNEWKRKPEERFDEFLSPIFFWIIVAVLPLTYTLLTKQELQENGILAVFFESKLLLGACIAVLPILIYVTWIELINNRPIRQSALQKIFYVQCYMTSPITLLITYAFLLTTTLGTFQLWFLVSLVLLVFYETFVMRTELKKTLAVSIGHAILPLIVMSLLIGLIVFIGSLA